MKLVLKGKLTWSFESGTVLETSPVNFYETSWNLNNLPMELHDKFYRITIEEITKDEANGK